MCAQYDFMHKLNETWHALNNEPNRFKQPTLARARASTHQRPNTTYSDYNRITGIQQRGVAKVKCIDMLIDVRTELMGVDMMTKSVGPAVLGVNMKLIGMSKCG